MALVMQLRSRCKKGCKCENSTTFNETEQAKGRSTKPLTAEAKPPSPSGHWEVSSSTNSNPTVLKNSKSNKHNRKSSRATRSKMNSQNQRKTKEKQNCKPTSRKVNKRDHSVDHSKTEVPVKVHRSSNTRSLKDAKEQTKHTQRKLITKRLDKNSKMLNADVLVVPIPESVPPETCGIVKSTNERSRRNPRRKCVLEKASGSYQGRSNKLASSKQAGLLHGTSQTEPSDSKNIQSYPVPSASQCPSATCSEIEAQTHVINVKTKLLEEQVAEMRAELSKEDAQIAKLKKLLSKKKHLVRSKVEKKKDQVHHEDRKESEIEQRTVHLQNRLKSAETNSQKEMLKLRNNLCRNWQLRVNKTQRAIAKMRSELRTKVMMWEKEKDTLELEMERDREGQKKKSNRHKYFIVCEKQLKKLQADLEKEKLGVSKTDLSDADKADKIKTVEIELKRLKTIISQVSMPPKEHMKAVAKRKEKDQLSTLIEEDLQCTICSEIIMQAMVLNCCHTFCKHCITRWTKRKDRCPVCRAPITSKFNIENLDRFIDKVVDKFDDAFKERRKKALEDRKEQERQLQQQIDSGYFDDHSDDDSSDDDFWDVWDDDDDDLSIDLDDDDDEGGWDDWDDDDDDDNEVDDDDDDDDDDDSSDTFGDDDDDDSGSDSYDCLIS